MGEEELESGENEHRSLPLEHIYAMRAQSMPPRDSWILLPPSMETNLTDQIQKEWLAKAKELRRIRGNFLVAVFEIEYSIDRIISCLLFPDAIKLVTDEQDQNIIPRYTESPVSLKPIFEQLFLKSADNMLSRKITILKILANQAPDLNTLVSNNLIERLRKIAAYRDVIAHYPIIFIPEGGELQALLIYGNHPIVLNKDFFEKYKRRFSSAAAELDAIFNQAIRRRSKVGGQEKLSYWRFYTGHADLDMENWLSE